MTDNEETGPSFSLASASAVFSSRSDDIFGSLGVLEQKHAAHQKSQESSELLEREGIIKHDPIVEENEDKEKPERSHSNSMSRYRGSLSNHRHNKNRSFTPWKNDHRHRNIPRDNFRHPRQLPPRSKKTPDFKKHPEKWTTYSLDDVPEKDLSDKSNTRAALDFLWERKNEREKQERLAAGLPAVEEKFESETAACSKGIISFSRKNKKSKEEKMDFDDKAGVPHLHSGDVVGKTLSEQDSGDFLSSSDCTEPLNSRSSFLKSQLSKVDDGNSYLSKSNYYDGDEQQNNDPVPAFKSRKGARKQFRKKNYNDEIEDNDD